jgi:diadenosine tetraphosphate (Ap4A) HIT family hydrolase
MFSLHPQLAADTIPIGELALSRVLLMNNAELPWLILVPRRENISEWHHLAPQDQLQLHVESMGVSSILMDLFNGDKLNTGALGNLVPQLHLHHIVRFTGDSIWPQPVWGNIEAKLYTESDQKSRTISLQQALGQQLREFTAC